MKKNNLLLNNAIKITLITTFVILSGMVANIANATNHWSTNHTVKSINVWEVGIFIYVDQSGISNPAGCSRGTGYVIATESPTYEALYKAALTAAAANLTLKMVVSDEPNSCVAGQPKLVALNVYQ